MSVVALVGLGCVDLPLAVEFGRKRRTVGYDVSHAKVESVRRHVDPTCVVVAVAHRQFVARPIPEYLSKVIERGCFIDVKNQFDMAALQQAGLTVWRM